MSYKLKDYDKIDFSDVEIEEGEKLKISHPGVFIKEDFLEPLGMSAYNLAKRLGVQESRISGILNGKRSITANTAIRLELLWGVSAEYWLRLQDAYDLAHERDASKDLQNKIQKMDLVHA